MSSTNELTNRVSGGSCRSRPIKRRSRAGPRYTYHPLLYSSTFIALVRSLVTNDSRSSVVVPDEKVRQKYEETVREKERESPSSIGDKARLSSPSNPRCLIAFELRRKAFILFLLIINGILQKSPQRSLNNYCKFIQLKP